MICDMPPPAESVRCCRENHALRPWIGLVYFTTCVTINNINIMNFGFQEILIIAFIVLLLFGGKKIPELMKGLGKGVKSFKDGINGVEGDMNQRTEDKKDEHVKNSQGE